MPNDQRKERVDMNFMLITQYVGDFMQRKMRHYTVQNDIPCVYRFLKHSIKEDAIYNIYGNTSNYFDDAKVYGMEVQRSVVPSTSTRTSMARLNLMTISHFMDHGNSLFDADTVNVFADYKNMTRSQQLTL